MPAPAFVVSLIFVLAGPAPLSHLVETGIDPPSSKHLTGSSSETLIDVGVGPGEPLLFLDDGFALADSESEHYYVVVVVSKPQPPGDVEPEDEAEYDCASADHPDDANESADRVATPIVEEATELADDVTSDLDLDSRSVSGFVPTCVAGPDACTPLGGLCLPYASYNVTSGRYFVNATDPADPWGGSSGAGIMADCEMCPPPACCQ